MCNIKIHETQPLLNLKLDRVMQDIVYKLVPGLQESKSALGTVKYELKSAVCEIQNNKRQNEMLS